MKTKHQHFKIYKPYGMLSQFDSNAKHEQKKRFLSELGAFPDGTMPIGRLDKKSEGLLLLTTDGKLSNHINQSGIEKEYYALVDGAISAKAIQDLQTGVKIGFDGIKYDTKPCKARILESTPNLPQRSQKIRDERHGPTTWVSITLKEGKFKQVRKMTSAVGYPTLRLVRIRIGKVFLDGLDVGEVCKLPDLPSII
ncbi:pseudouridine synthase [Mesoflavibacter profundi]|uniref:pseudouridine synthase n=1 Tax=Mesoflavibacter profundi TaxID=2708110 RepID=UPI0035151C08